MGFRVGHPEIQNAPKPDSELGLQFWSTLDFQTGEGRPLV